MEYGPSGEGGTLPDGLYPGDGLLYFQERVYLGPQAKLVSLLDPWVTPQSHPDGTYRVTWAAHADTPPAPYHTDKIGWAIHGPLPVDLQAKGEGGEEERVDLRRHIEARRYKSLHAFIYCARPGPPMNPRLSDCGNPEGRSAATDEDRQGRYIIPPGLGSSTLIMSIGT